MLMNVDDVLAELCRNSPNLPERMIRQQVAAPRVGFEIHDLALCHPSFAGSCELSLCATSSMLIAATSDALEDWMNRLVRATAKSAFP